MAEGIDLSALDGDTALRLGFFMGEQMNIARRAGWDDAVKALRDAEPNIGVVADICADYLEAIAPGAEKT